MIQIHIIVTLQLRMSKIHWFKAHHELRGISTIARPNALDFETHTQYFNISHGCSWSKILCLSKSEPEMNTSKF